MSALWPTYLFLIVFVILIEFVLSLVLKRKFSLMKGLSQAGFACVGLTLYFWILGT